MQAVRKAATITIRISPYLKQLIIRHAAADHRSITSFIVHACSELITQHKKGSK